MLYPLEKLLEDHPSPTVIRSDQKVADALAIMIANDFSQLPVVDHLGQLTGMISEKSITRNYYHQRANVSLLDLSVIHCQARPATMSPSDDLFDALERLKTSSAIVIIKDRKPYRILTDFDTTTFFRDLSEGMLMIENIELRLRKYIETIFASESTRDAALMKVFGADRRNPQLPLRDYERMSFGDTIQFITHDENWDKFQVALAPKELFRSLMDPIRQIRNQLAHFRDELDPVQRDALINAQQWMDLRPKLKQEGEPSKVIHVSQNDLRGAMPTSDQPFAPLTAFLVTKTRSNRSITVSFDDIEKLIGEPLPISANQHDSWWENDPNSAYSRAWLNAGCLTAEVDLTGRNITFKVSTHARMQLFFANVLERIKQERPGLTRATRVFAASWFRFSAGRSKFAFVWVFTNNQIVVELSIDGGDGLENKAIFDKLLEQKEPIEQTIGKPMIWDRNLDRRSTRIRVGQHVDLDGNPTEIEAAKAWAVEYMVKFADTFQPLIKEL